MRGDRRAVTTWLADGVLLIGADTREIRIENSEEREIPIILQHTRKPRRRLLLVRRNVLQIS